MLLWLIWRLVRHPGMEAVVPVLICLWAALAVFKSRQYSLKLQDRLIRLEERLRLASVLGEPLRTRAAGLSERQLIALRFACDGELPSLTEKALDANLAAAVIKKQIVNWRPDYWRV
jgi:hypothetical protein